MRKILLIEDSLELSAYVQSELNNEGFQVLAAANGLDGLAMAEHAHPDLVILDWMLPGMDGLELLRRIRTSSPVPVLMLTARNSEIDRVLGLELGADDYLTKPFSLRELIARVHALLRRLEHIEQILANDRHAGTRMQQARRLTLQPETHRAWVDEQEIDLTPIEFALLQLFLSNSGRVFSRTYLQETVWGESYLPGDRSVDNAILRLRKKLGPPGEQIEAVWGVGYRFRKMA